MYPAVAGDETGKRTPTGARAPSRSHQPCGGCRLGWSSSVSKTLSAFSERDIGIYGPGEFISLAMAVASYISINVRDHKACRLCAFRHLLLILVLYRGSIT